MFKYSIRCAGDIQTKASLVKDLEKLGYIISPDNTNPSHNTYIAINPCEKFSVLNNGEYGYFSSCYTREYEFNIDNEWEYKAALAIASITDGDKFQTGEWVKAVKDYSYTHVWFDKGDIFPLTKVRYEEKYHPKGLYFQMRGVRGCGPHPGEGGFTNAAVYIDKVSPEEVIEYFKPKEMGQLKDYIIKDKEFVLPEKWAFKPRNYDEQEVFRSWIPADIRESYKDLMKTFFCYPNFDTYEGFRLWAHTDGERRNGMYTEITFEQFKKYVLKENNMNKKIIGYNLKDKNLSAAASMIAFGNTCWTLANPNISIEAPSIINKLRDAGVLDLWFTPVYEEEKKQVIFNIGNPVKSITINNNKTIAAWSRTFSIEDVKKVREILARSDYGIIGSNKTGVYVKKLWIGCPEEGTEVNIGDLDKIIYEFNKMFPNG